MSRKSLFVFDVLDAKTMEPINYDFAITDTGELMKKNAKGIWIPVPDTGDMIISFEMPIARRW